MDFRQQWKRKISRQKQLQKDEGEKTLEEKETKNKFWKGVLVGALVTAFAGFAVVGFATGIWIIGRRTSESQSIQATGTDANKLDMKKIEPKLQYMEALIDKYFLFDENMTEEEQKKNGTAEDWIYRGYMYSLNDPYSVYYDKDEYTSLNEENSGTYCGIGVQVSQNVYTGIITAVKVFKDSPAQEAGMLPGDILYKVEDIEATGEDLSLLVSDHIRGEEGTKVHLTVYRQSTDEYVEMDVERRMVENPTVEYEMVENKAGYISLSSFEEVSSEQFKKAVDDLTAQGMEKLIVDLRNNGGGVVQAAKEIADYLLPDGKTIVSFKGKGIDDSTYSSDDGHEVDVPIVLLVNGESASASEVLTGALKDNNWATIIGEKTFGKGIAQGVFNLPDGSGLKLTTAYYYTPSGECIHKLGIEPDVTVALAEDLKSKIEIPKDEDNQLQTALEVFGEGVDAVKAKISEETGETEAANDDFEAKVKENLEIEKETGAEK